MNDESDQQGLTDALFNKIARYVYDQAGIALSENKRELVRARIGKVIRQRKLKGFRDYIRFMEEDETGEAVEEVLNAISTNLTSFFREPKHFEFLTGTLLPELERGVQRRGRRLRAWSAGCSTGEEPYTLAITLLEHFGSLDGWDARILATDLDTSVLARAQAGVYDMSRVETISRPVLQKYFMRGGGGSDGKVRVKPFVQELIRFRQLNLMHPWPFRGAFDFIFCRNVMIYFDRPTQQGLIDRFFQFLRPGGYLFIGHSEGLTGLNHHFRYVQPTVYMKPA